MKPVSPPQAGDPPIPCTNLSGGGTLAIKPCDNICRPWHYSSQPTKKKQFMVTEPFRLTGHTGQALAARLDRPQGPMRAVALFAHCFTCSKDLSVVRRIAGKLNGQGIAVLRFDFTGLGHSEGEFANTNFSSNVEDLVLAANALAEQIMPPQLIIGHSLGGTAAIAAAGQIDSLEALITIGSPSEPSHILGLLDKAIPDIESKGEQVVELAGRSFTIKNQFLQDVTRHRIEKSLSKLTLPYLILHSPADAVVRIQEASALFLAANHPKSFISLGQADHLLTKQEDAEYVGELISAWVGRYLKPAPTSDPLETKGVWVVESEPSRLTQDIRIGQRHRLIADEPTQLGGQDLGPNPYELLASALGACTSMTIRMYAKHKKLPLAHVAVEVCHHKNDEKIDIFERRISLKGDLSEAEQARLIEIANKCPVHKTLESTSRIETTQWAPSKN